MWLTGKNCIIKSSNKFNKLTQKHNFQLPFMLQPVWMKLRYSAKCTKRRRGQANAHFGRNVGAEQRVRLDRQSDQRLAVLFRTRGSAIRRKCLWGRRIWILIKVSGVRLQKSARNNGPPSRRSDPVSEFFYRSAYRRPSSAAIPYNQDSDGYQVNIK